MINITCPICNANANLIAECDTCLGTGTLDPARKNELNDKLTSLREQIFSHRVTLRDALLRLNQIYSSDTPLGNVIRAILTTHEEGMETILQASRSMEAATAKVARAICG